MEALKEDSL